MPAVPTPPAVPPPPARSAPPGGWAARSAVVVSRQRTASVAGTGTAGTDAPWRAPAVVAGDDRAEAVLVALLAAHVPLSLLLDLADPHGPHSAELLWREPGSAQWLTG